MTRDDSSELVHGVAGTRRQYLAVVGAGTAGFPAGCGGDGGGDTTPAGVRVLIAAGSDVVGVSVLGRNVDSCSEAIETVRNRLVDTVALI